MMMRRITIRSRLGELAGLANEDIAIFDCFDKIKGDVVRHYVLLHESVKMMFEPWDWKNKWYVDLLNIHWVDEATLELKDLFLDIIVEGNGPIYRMIDLEELADALKTCQISVEDAYIPLQKLQLFLDNHLHGGKDFPPAALQPFLDDGRCEL